MTTDILIFFLLCTVIGLLVIIFYQQFIFTKGIQHKLKKISQKLSDILDYDTDEKVMVFTDNKTLMDLSGQINRLIIERQKIKVNYKKQEISSKKMLSNISHDIKTPLTVILGYLEIMRLSTPNDEILEKIEQKATQVMELIDQFFTLSKLESGDMNLTISKLNISELCRKNILDFYDILVQKNFQVEIEIPEKEIFVMGDRDAIHRILFNLISNVIRYGNAGNYIGVFLREDKHKVSIHIKDKGKGIEQGFATHVFERLYTMEDSRNRNIQGNGLGLTIAKNLATKMGGNIQLISEPNVATTFTVEFKKYIRDIDFERNS